MEETSQPFGKKSSSQNLSSGHSKASTTNYGNLLEREFIVEKNIEISAFRKYRLEAALSISDISNFNLSKFKIV